ncbi:MAG: cupin domain-containing protein [candidate division Zixibacteria bacterium]|nr:cupin domain-containing protein [candidate division Zixibacteria bacterium]
MPKIDIVKKLGKIKKSFTRYLLTKVDDYNVYLVVFQGEYKRNRHPGDEFFYVLKGEIQVEIDGKLEKVRKGEGFLVSKGTWHSSHSRRKSLVIVFEKMELPTEFA